MNLDNFSPKGYVKIKDQNGNIVFEGNNMIVETGKKFIFSILWDRFLPQSSVSSGDTSLFTLDNGLTKPTSFSDSMLYGAFLSTTSKKTYYTMELSDALNASDKYTNLSNKTYIRILKPFYTYTEYINGSTNNNKLLKVNQNDEHGYFLHFELTNIGLADYVKEGETSITEAFISSLGIVLLDDKNNFSNDVTVGDLKLFSRINFDPLYLSANTSFSIEYYIYF